MIIPLHDYRTSLTFDGSDGTYYPQTLASPLRQPTFALQRMSSPDLPDDFDDFNAKAFIDRAWGLATQI